MVTRMSAAMDKAHVRQAALQRGTIKAERGALGGGGGGLYTSMPRFPPQFPAFVSGWCPHTCPWLMSGLCLQFCGSGSLRGTKKRTEMCASN